MKSIFSLLFFVIFICNCVYSVNSLTLYVDPSSKSVDPKCGTTLNNSCKTFLLAYRSYSHQTDGTNSTALTLSLVDGTYKAGENGFPGGWGVRDTIYLRSLTVSSYSQRSENVILTDSTDSNPFFPYVQPSDYRLEIIISKITFVNSSYIIYSNYGADVSFLNCVFTNSTTFGGLVRTVGGSFYL
ncbi:hypothetical protein CYY_006539 [Polysphondylium violaceum]|uniref:Carbohydrate binding domain-containing protein n=1 Tax=Polysphondylium violaceum TaxID=133409 RepID=A0A8J4PS28_9MYCE|nr:hypothetical protein CYY_006539 [Polysphondylium violaceum]